VFRTCLDASYAGQLWNGVMVMDLIEAFESDLRNKSHFLRCGVTRDVLVREMATAGRSSARLTVRRRLA